MKVDKKARFFFLRISLDRRKKKGSEVRVRVISTKTDPTGSNLEIIRPRRPKYKYKELKSTSTGLLLIVFTGSPTKVIILFCQIFITSIRSLAVSPAMTKVW